MHVSTILMKELSLVEQGGLKLLLDMSLKSLNNSMQGIIRELPHRKAATGSCSIKKCSEVCFCVGVWGVLDGATTTVRKRAAASGGTLAKLGALLKTFLCLGY